MLRGVATRSVLIALCAALTATPASAQFRSGWSNSPPALSWTAEAGDSQLTNQAVYGVPTSEGASLGLVWQRQLDGAVVASPLALGSRIFVATEAGTVVALDAADGSALWERRFGAQEAVSCGSWGFSSTGALDLARDLLYVANADGLVHALDLETGAEARGWPVPVTERPEVEYAWGGLRIVNDRLYVPIASYCDAPDANGRYAEGRVVALGLPGGATAASWDTVPGPDNMGGVWGFGGVSAEPDGSAIYTAVGNSTVLDAACNCLVDDAGFGDSIVRLTRDLVPVSSDRPANIPSVDDYDFGAAPLLFQPPGCPPLAAANNKNKRLYVWERSNLARGPIFQTTVENGTAAFVGAPSWSSGLKMLYDSGAKILLGDQVASGGVTAIRMGPGCSFVPVWRRTFGSGTQAAPLVVGDVLFAVGGHDGGYAVLDARTGGVLGSFPTEAPTLSPPIAIGRAIVAADYSGVVRLFGPPSLGGRPAAR